MIFQKEADRDARTPFLVLENGEVVLDEKVDKVTDAALEPYRFTVVAEDRYGQVASRTSSSNVIVSSDFKPMYI